ncbi:hypothetical protein DYB25_002263 [Aphanomyces astaci]|uniref:Pentacotripeptide-repeat region of PRORP domain-containing protein n=1 Tax=Aphanomyces astaci TaxID=112090 RepID=A0A397BDH7_APHAT|nr:hypothetical protein DYB25_002263 [Aphanomyces astaci]
MCVVVCCDLLEASMASIFLIGVTRLLEKVFDWKNQRLNDRDVAILMQSTTTTDTYIVTDQRSHGTLRLIPVGSITSPRRLNAPSYPIDGGHFSKRFTFARDVMAVVEPDNDQTFDATVHVCIVLEVNAAATITCVVVDVLANIEYDDDNLDHVMTHNGIANRDDRQGVFHTPDAQLNAINIVAVSTNFPQDRDDMTMWKERVRTRFQQEYRVVWNTPFLRTVLSHTSQLMVLTAADVASFFGRSKASLVKEGRSEEDVALMQLVVACAKDVAALYYGALGWRNDGDAPLDGERAKTGGKYSVCRKKSVRVLVLLMEFPLLLSGNASAFAAAFNGGGTPNQENDDLYNTTHLAAHWLACPAQLHALISLLFRWKQKIDGRDVVVVSGNLRFGLDTFIQDTTTSFGFHNYVTGPIAAAGRPFGYEDAGTTMDKRIAFTHRFAPAVANYVLVEISILEETLPDHTTAHSALVNGDVVHADNVRVLHDLKRLNRWPQWWRRYCPMAATAFWTDLVVKSEPPHVQQYIRADTALTNLLKPLYAKYNFVDSTRMDALQSTPGPIDMAAFQSICKDILTSAARTHVAMTLHKDDDDQAAASKREETARAKELERRANVGAELRRKQEEAHLAELQQRSILEYAQEKNRLEKARQDAAVAEREAAKAAKKAARDAEKERQRDEDVSIRKEKSALKQMKLTLDEQTAAGGPSDESLDKEMEWTRRSRMLQARIQRREEQRYREGVRRESRQAKKNSVTYPFATRWLSSSPVASLQKCASTGNWKSALNILAELDQRGETDAEAYELAIEALGRDHKFEAMEMLMNTMKNDGVVATSTTVDMLVQAHMAHTNGLKIIQVVTDRLRENNPVSLPAFQAAMGECSTLGKVEYPETMLQLLRDTPNCATPLSADEYAALIRCFGVCKRSDLSMHALHLMEEKGIEGTVDVYTQLIRAHISVGACVGRSCLSAVNQALHVFSLCDRRGVVLGENIYAATIGKLCDKKGFWLATELFATMDAKGVHASHYCMAKMILAYIRTNNPEAAHAMWARIRDHDRPATIATYMGGYLFYFVLLDSFIMATCVGIMHDCVVTGEMDILLDVFSQMQLRHEKLPNVAYSFAIRGMGRQGDTRGALELMETFVDTFGPPIDATTYIAVFNALARSPADMPVETTRAAIMHYWDMMVRHVPELHAPAYASAAGAFASIGALDSLERLLEHTRENLPADSNVLMYSGIVSGFAKASVDYSEHIRTFIQRMIEAGAPVNDASVRAASDAFVKYQHWNYMEELLAIMEPSAFNRPQGVVGDFLSKLLEVNHWPLARKTINAALAWDIQPHIRGKPQVLQTLADSTHESPEWKIAYSLALETVSFTTINDEHVFAVCNAMKVLYRAERHALVARLWYALKSKTHGPFPIDAYKCIVLTSLTSGFPKAATAAATEMISMLHRYHQDIVDTSDVADVVSVILSAFAQHNDWDMVTTLFELMEMHNFLPNGFAYLGALRAYAQLDQTDNVHRLLIAFEDYMSTTHMDPSEMSNTLSSLTSMYATKRNDDMVLTVFELMNKFQLAPNSYAYNAAIRAYSRRQQLDKVEKIATFLAKSDEPVHERVLTSILNSYLLVQDIPAIERVMKQFKCDPNAVLQSYFAFNKFGPVVTLLKSQGNYLERRACQLTPAMQTNGLKWLLARGATTQAADVALFMLQNDYHILPHMFEHILDSLSLECEFEVGSTLLEAYNSKRTFLNKSSGVVDSIITMMGNTKQYDGILDMLTESTQLFDVQQYGLGMFLCMDGRAHVHVLKIFEKMRQRFIEPNGQVFCLALDACQALKDTRVGKLIVQDIVRHKFEKKIAKELHARLEFALRPEALALDPTLVERVATLTLFLESCGLPIPHTFGGKLLLKSTSDRLTLPTRTRIYASLKASARLHQSAPTRPWWKADSNGARNNGKF